MVRFQHVTSRVAALAVGAALAGCAPGESGGSADGALDHLMVPSGGRFRHVSSYDTTGGNLDRLEIAPGDSAAILDVTGPGVIRRLWMTVSSRDPHYLRRIALKMYWDGEAAPSVSAPLGDFFGNGFDRRHYAALPMGVSSGGFYVYLPMPFRERARIVVENGTGRSIDALYFNVDLVNVERLPDDFGTFHAWWHRDPRTTARTPHLVLQARGRGQFVGSSLNAESHSSRLWFLEGDEIFTVDGEFRGQGTGTEDYFNGGWYFDQGAFSAPYHGVVVKDDSLARIAAYRWHLPDPIPFERSIRVELEHGHANREVADYATMAYWYQTEPHEPFPLLPPPGERRVLSVKIPPGAIPLDSLSLAGSMGELRIAIPAPRPDRYEVVVFPNGGPDRAAAVYRVNGGAGRELGLAADEANTTLPAVPIDTVGADTLIHLVARGTGDVAPAAVWLRPLRRWAREWSVVGPFPNPQVLGSEYSPAIDSVYPPELVPELASRYTTREGRSITWKRAQAGDDGRVRLNGQFTPNDWVAAYAQAFLFSPDDRQAVLLLGADDAHVLWLNGERVSERQGRHISEPDDLAIQVQLRAGWNRVLLKLADLDGGWAFLLRAADPSGQLRWSARTR